MVGKIQRCNLRDIWKHEAYDFTKWIEDNIDVINEVIDRNLSNPEAEKAAGDFSIDLVAEDENNNPVIIENQLEKSNHDHLGKIITYLTAIDAKAAIWIVSEPRAEHIKAITWLNETSAADFYLLKIEAIKIGNSYPAPLLTLIVGPSQEAIASGETKKELAERHILRMKFWQGLLEKAKGKTKLIAGLSANKYSWAGNGSGFRGVGYNYSVTQHEAQVEVYIDRGKDAETENKQIFDKLTTNKEAIEKLFGDTLEWQRLDQKRACRIRKLVVIGGYRDESKWDEIHKALVDYISRLEKAFKPYIAQLKD